MKKILEKIKGLKIFTKIMIVYSIILIGAVVGVCIWEWGVLSDYEAKNQAAKEQSNPDVYIEKYLDNLNYEEYKNIVKESIEEDFFKYYTMEQVAGYIAEEINNGELKAVKSENWTEKRPEYCVYAGDKHILTLTLAVASKDDFGYNRWKEGTFQVISSPDFTNSIEIIVDNTMKVYINNVEMVEENKEVVYTDTDTVSRLNELSGREHQVYKYKITNLMEEYEIKVVDASQNEVTYTESDGVRDYLQTMKDEDKKEFESLANEAFHSYINTLYKFDDLENTKTYCNSDGLMYLILDTQYWQLIHWNTKPKSIDFLKEEITNIRMINENTLICNIRYEIFKEYEWQTNEGLSEETIAGQAVFVKRNGIWKLDFMNLE